MNNTDHADTQQDRTTGITRDAIDEARDNKTHATALVAAIVARKAALDGTDDWERIAAIAYDTWATREWASFADAARIPTPTYTVRDMATAMLAQVDTDGAPTGDQMFDLHIDRRRGIDVAAAIIADHHRLHLTGDWVHLGDWLAQSWGDSDWHTAAEALRLRFTVTPRIATEACNILRSINLHGHPTTADMLAHDAHRGDRRTLHPRHGARMTAADVNPNLVAYAHSLGYQVTDLTMGPPVNARYMAWITEQAKAYEVATRETLRGGGWYDRFTAWLTTRYPEPVIAGCTSCDHTVPAAEIYESGTHGEPGWFCDGCSYPTPRRHRKATAGTKAP